MKRKFTFLIAAALMLLTMMASTGTMLGQTREDLVLTFPLTSNPGGWPTSNSTTLTNYTYTLNNVDYTFALKNVKCNSGYLMLTQPAALGLPAISGYKLTKVVASNSNGCSTSTKVGISSSASSPDYIEGGAIQTWSTTGSSYTYTLTSTDANTMYYMYVTNKNAQVISLALTYSPVSTTAPSINANNVDIAYDATGGAIEYTINNPATGGNLTAEVTNGDWLENLQVGETVTFNCDPNQAAAARTATVTLTYTYSAKETVTKNVTVTQAGNPDGPGSANNPYTVAQAIAAVDAGTGTQGVYATGIVSTIVTPYGTNNYQNITFNMVDEAGDEVFLQAYRCGGDEAPNVLVGDIAVVTGNLTKYGQTYEFASGCSVVSLEHPSTPYITADDVEITYDANADEIEYEIVNPVDGGVLTASTTSDWLTLGDDFSSPIAFTCTLNQAAASRTATVTLTYTYNAKATVTKNVTVTQTGNPNIFDNITDITEVGTAYSVKGTVVAVNTKGFIMGDGTGYVYTYLNKAPEVAVGNMITVSGTTSSYGHVIQFPSNATIAEATSSGYDGTPDVTVITEVPDYSEGYHLSTYLQFEGSLTKSGSNYLVSLGDSQIRIAYPTEEQTAELSALENKTVRVHGFFSGISGSGTNAVFTATMESIEEVVVTTPSITIAPATVNAPFVGAEGTLTITYENIPDLIAFDILFCDANGDELQGDDPDWIYAEINEPTSPTDNYTVYYVIGANDGEARNAYFKVFTYTGSNLDEVYSNLVTVNQAEYVAPTYAALPFAFNGGRSDIENTDGLTQEGLGSDYNANTNPNTKLKFDGTGDWLLLQFDERPGTLTFNIKGNSFSGSTFKVQTSEDGVTYSDLETYTELGDTQDESFDNLGENVRYIKWIYTEKSNGNVGLGNIALAAYAEPTASITVADGDANIDVDANGVENATLAIAYENLTITDPADFDIQYYNANGDELGKDDEPIWMAASIQENATQDGYEVLYDVFENDGEARTAYFKVFAMGDQDFVYSNLVTVSQEAYVAPTATITVADGDANIDVDANGVENATLTIAYENLTITDPADFNIQYYNANGDELGKDDEPIWMAASIQENATQDGYEVLYDVFENDGEARTAYFKVFAMGDQDFVYSNLVTINQAAYVVDYATLPFEWEGGTTANFNALNGTSTNSVGDYGENQGVYRMKLDYDGDYIQVKTNEQPGIVTVGVKMIGGASTSTLTVQGSADGVTFTDVEALTISGKQNDVLTLVTENSFASTDRYVRMVFTKGSNVGVGPISIAQVDLTPSITVAPATLNLNCDGGDGELTVTHKNLANDPQLAVIFVESDGETITTCNWIQASINAAGNVAGHIDANTGEARTAYLKVYGLDADANIVSSNLVTFNQAEYTGPSIEFETTSIDITFDGEQRTLSFDYEGLGSNPTFEIRYYESDGVTVAAYDWFGAAIVEGDNKVDITVEANTGAARSAYFKVYGDNGTVNTESNLVTVNQEAYSQLATYTLVESIDDLTPGYHYYIAGKDGENWFAMGGQNNNNRSAISVNVSNNQISETDNVREFVISANNDGLYTIYDELVSEKTPGYLYAPAGSSNYLRTQVTNTDNGVWTISIDDETSVVTIKANITTDKYMRYNSNNTIFSCYSNNTSQKDVYLFKKDNDTNIAYYGVETTYTEPNIPAGETITVGAGSVMTVPNNFENSNPDNLVIQDGGQLVFDGDGVMATMLKSTAHAGAKDAVGDWYTIASPLKEDVTTSTSNTNLTTGMSSSEYDLYRYDEATAVWENSKDGANSSHFSEIELGRGYLYWREDGQDLFFAGELNNENVDYILTADGTGNLKGFNLIGNPFSQNITMANISGVSLSGGYVLTKAGGWGATVGEIAPCQGFLVQVENEANITISKNTGSKSRDNHDYIAFTMANSQYEDVTYAMFEEGLGLHKISHRNNNIPMIYIPQNGDDYAIAMMGNETEVFSLNVKAMTTGQYTLTMDATGKYDYIHVIDRMTGEDIDMLIENEYTFVASPRDNENRFIVKLRYNANYSDVIGDIFAYQNGSDIIINGEGELQVFDMTGRFVMSRTINGNESINTDAFNTGVYVFRMIGSEVKTQKIVVR